MVLLGPCVCLGWMNPEAATFHTTAFLALLTPATYLPHARYGFGSQSCFRAVLSPRIHPGWGGSALHGKSRRKGWAEAE